MYTYESMQTCTNFKFYTFLLGAHLQGNDIGITHVCHALTFAGSRGSCLNTRPLAKALGLIMGSRVDTSGVEIPSNYNMG